MKQKINKLFSEPFTIKKYLSFIAILYVLYAIIFGILCCFMVYCNKIKGWFDKKFGKKGTKKED